MNITNQLNSAGEHPFLIQGEVGDIEGVLTVPDEARKDVVAILGHPHSLQGGTMNNKVVTTMARVFKALNIPSIRFNFRGVGQSAGAYNEGIGESQDMLTLVSEWEEGMPGAKFIFAGFSFGSFVAYRAAAQHDHALLITIAPPVHHYDYSGFSQRPSPWIIVQGDQDEVVPPHLVLDFAKNFTPELPLLLFNETGHFFHGKLTALKSHLIDEIREQVPAL